MTSGYYSTAADGYGGGNYCQFRAKGPHAASDPDR